MNDYVVIVKESSDLPPCMCVGPFGDFSSAKNYADECAKENPDVHEIIITPLYGVEELTEVEA